MELDIESAHLWNQAEFQTEETFTGLAFLGVSCEPLLMQWPIY